MVGTTARKLCEGIGGNFWLSRKRDPGATPRLSCIPNFMKARHECICVLPLFLSRLSF